MDYFSKKENGQKLYKKADISLPYDIGKRIQPDSRMPRYKKTGAFWKKTDSNNSNAAVILCGGDLMCEPLMSEACYFDGEYDFKPCFRYLRGALAESDLAIANLETIVSERLPFAREVHIVPHSSGKRFHCNAPTAYLDALRYAGFDGFVLANNHNADGGYEGIVDTLSNLDERGFLRTGMFGSRDEQRFLLAEINGIRIAVLSYTEFINRGLDSELLTDAGCTTMLNRYSEEKAKKDVSDAKAMGAEFVLVYIHFIGKEYSHEILDRQRATAREIANAGADCIMGSHMHAIQAYDRITAADGRVVPVIYSLGNLISSDQTGMMTRRSVLYRLKLRKESGRVRIAWESYIPVRVVEGVRSSDFVAHPTLPKYRNNLKSELLETAQKTIASEIGGKIGTEFDCWMDRIDLDEENFERRRSLTIGKICKIIGADPHSVPEELRFKPVSYVTARYTWVRQGCAYFSRFLGNTEAPEARLAYQRGAAVLFSSKMIFDENGKALPCIVVKDPAQRFYQFSRWLKSLYDIPTLAITGSVGKTTTKEMVYSVLSRKYNTLKNNGNANTYAAIADTIFKLTREHQVYVQEVCAFSPGWVEGGSKMLAPDMCLITNIGYPHVDLYGSIDNIFYDKTSLVRNLPEDGVAFLNFDDERLAGLKTDKRVISFAIENEADYKAENIVYNENEIVFDVKCSEGLFPIRIHMPGAHNILNALAAFAVGRYMNIDAPAIAQALDEYRSEGMRQNVLNVGGYNLYMDCYNSAPNSVLTSVHALALLEKEPGCRRIAVLGDIPRLGDQAPRIHREVAEKLLEEKGIDLYILFGPHCANMASVMKEAGREYFYTQDRDELNAFIRETVHLGDIILFKAGHPSALAKTVDQVFGTSFHITDGDVLLDNAHDAGNAEFRARWIDEAIELRGMKKEKSQLVVPETTDGKTPVRRIGSEAFKGSSLRSVTSSASLRNIGRAAFMNCAKLEELSLTEGLMIIEEKAFEGCTSLTSVKLPDSLIDLGEKCFSGCSRLQHVYLGEKVGHIGEDAFSGCGRVTLHVRPGSCAERYAVDDSIPYQLER